MRAKCAGCRTARCLQDLRGRQPTPSPCSPSSKTTSRRTAEIWSGRRWNWPRSGARTSICASSRHCWRCSTGRRHWSFREPGKSLSRMTVSSPSVPADLRPGSGPHARQTYHTPRPHDRGRITPGRRGHLHLHQREYCRRGTVRPGPAVTTTSPFHESGRTNVWTP